MRGVKDVTKPKGRSHNDVGNIYSLIGEVVLRLEQNGQYERADEFVLRSIELPSYDAVLQLSENYIQFHHGEEDEPEID